MDELLVILVWLIPILFFYFRGKIKPTLEKLLPAKYYTCATKCFTYFVLERKISGPFISKEHFSNMKLITEI